ncbi:50S ribosomal protein L29 [Candidatus Micrarchaeota archaeon]|nr:50S ribosomal protein L29 [Candidatus Micrarchaeota archaeon]
MKRVAELRKLSDKEIAARLDEIINELLVENSKKGSGGRAFNPGKLRNLKKLKATILTIIKERETKKIYDGEVK